MFSGFHRRTVVARAGLAAGSSDHLDRDRWAKCTGAIRPPSCHRRSAAWRPARAAAPRDLGREWAPPPCRRCFTATQRRRCRRRSISCSRSMAWVGTPITYVAPVDTHPVQRGHDTGRGVEHHQFAHPTPAPAPVPPCQCGGDMRAEREQHSVLVLRPVGSPSRARWPASVLSLCITPLGDAGRAAGERQVDDLVRVRRWPAAGCSPEPRCAGHGALPMRTSGGRETSRRAPAEGKCVDGASHGASRERVHSKMSVDARIRAP